MIVSAQIRAARAMIRWSAEDLAHRAHVPLASIRRAEAVDGPPPIAEDEIANLRQALERAGVLFLDPHMEGPGVRLRKQVAAPADAHFVSDGNEG